MTSRRHLPRLAREHRQRGFVMPALVLSLLFHGLTAIGLTQIRMPVPEEQPETEVLQIAFVSRGKEEGDKEAAVVQPVQPRPDQPNPVQPEPVSPRPSPKPAPGGLFPLLAKSKQPEARMNEPLVPKQTFEQYQQARVAPFLPTQIPDGGGSPDGEDSIDSEGRDRCVPFPNRQLDRVYLLFDSSGSMSDQLRAQALSCAHQYAQAAIDDGASVVVANFAATSTFHEATTNMTDVALALRGNSDPRSTVLPSNELNPFLNQDPGARADLVILSDGFLPNYRDVLPWYRYFLELNPENRGYMYTLGTPGHPEVVAALRQAGFDVYVYRIL